jgi:hypothetical protein
MELLTDFKSVAVKNAMVALKDSPGICTWLNPRCGGSHNYSLAGSSEVSESATADI